MFLFKLDCVKLASPHLKSSSRVFGLVKTHLCSRLMLMYRTKSFSDGKHCQIINCFLVAKKGSFILYFLLRYCIVFEKPNAYIVLCYFSAITISCTHLAFGIGIFFGCLMQ